MIALLLAGRAFAQDPEAPAPETPADTDWEPVTIAPTEPTPEPEAPAVPAEEPAAAEEPVPWVDVAPEERDGFLRYAISGEIGSLANDDPAYDLFSDGNGMGSAGVALGVHLTPVLAVVGGWHHFRHGARISVGGDGSDADFDGDKTQLQSAWSAHQGSLGLRTNATVRDVLFPYVSAQGLLMGARMRLDDDASVNDNPGQVQASALLGGVMGTAGVEIRVPPQSGVQLGFTLEFGYGWLARADFDAFGSMQPGGFVARSGLGLRF